MYKKYIKRNGKSYGPYYYKSSRDESGKVINKYVKKEAIKGSATNFFKHNNWWLVIPALALVILLFILPLFRLTGNVQIKVENSYNPGENLEGKITFTLKQGELIPADSRVFVNLGSISEEFPLSDLTDVSKISGNYYVEGKQLQGSGEGYGVIGSKTIYPNVNFDLRILSESAGTPEETPEQPSQPPTETPTTPENPPAENPAETPSNEQPSTPPAEIPTIPENPPAEIPTIPENPPAENSPITGASVSESEFIVSGTASKGNDFTYALESGQSAELVPGSVKVDGNIIDDDKVSFSVSGNEVRVSSDYSTTEEGYGSEFLGGAGTELNVDVSKLNISAEEGTLSVRIAYGDVDIASAEESIVMTKKKMDQTIAIQETKLKIKDASGNVLGEEIEVFNNSGGKHDIRVNLSKGPIKSIHFKDVEGTDNLVRIDDIPREGVFSNYAEVYAIDPTGMNFSDAVVTVNAKGSVLMKCKEWDFDNRVCNGEWTKMMDITPGEDYNLVLTPDDPAFAEYNYTTYPASQINGQKAYASADAGALPPASGPAVQNETEFSSANYMGINLSDNIRADTSANNLYRVHRFVYNITQSISSIVEINLTWEGYDTGSNAARRTVNLYVWNYTGSKWGSSLASGTSATDQIFNVILSSGLNNYVNSGGALTFIVESANTGGALDLYTDYTSMKVKYDSPPNATLVSPANGNITNVKNATFNCSAVDDYKLKNITFYWNYSGSFVANGTIVVNGTYNSTTFLRTNLSNGAIKWSCYACDNASQCAFASANWTVSVNYTAAIAPDNAPNVTLISPLNGNITNVNNATFNCSATDDYKLKNITFYWNYSGSFVANVTTAVNGTSNSTTFLRTNLSNGTIKWNCYACDNASQCAFASANWTVNMNYSACVPNMTNTSWSNWANLSCVGSQRNQSRFKVQYDSNSCGTISNTTYYEYQLFGPVYLNTSWSDWLNVSCLIDDTMNQTRNLTQYDSYGCVANQTFFDFRHTEWCCMSNMTNTTWSGWANQGNCKIDDLQLQNRSRIEYDTNNCGTITNVTHWEYKNVSCNYCSYGVVISNWTDWTNITCLYGDMMNQTRNKTEYDENYSICYAITGIPSDLWNSGNNNTYFEYRNTASCNYCTENILGSFNTSCDTADSLIQYWTDTNYSTCCAVTGLSSDCHINNGSYINQTLSCNYCTENITGPFNTTCNSSNLLIQYYVDSNYSSCCAVTGFISDCGINAPAYANQTLGCQYDTIPPWFNSSNTLPQPNSQYNQTNVIPIVSSLSENSIVFANISWDSTSQIVNLVYNGTQWYYDSTFTNTTYPGTYTIVINATDTSGNSNITATNFTINDITAPVILDILPANGTKFNPGQAINVTANVTDLYYDSVASAIAQLTYPNGTSVNYTMNESDDSQIFDTILNISDMGIHNITIIAVDSSGNSNKGYAWINLTWDDVTPPTILTTEIEPYDPAVGYNVSLSMTSTDNIAVSGMFANITLPNGTVIAVQLPSNYTLPLVGRYNVTFWANDSSGNVAAYEDYFVVGSIPVNVTFNVVDYLLGGIPVNLTIYLAGTDKEVLMHDFIGNILDSHTDILYDLYFYDSLGNNISVRLNGVNLSLYPNSTLGLDRNFAILGNLVTYGVNSSYGFSSAIVRLSYAGTGYSDENSLVLEKCNNWDFTARTCLGSWDDITSQANQNNILHYFEVSTTSFSGFGIKEPAVKPVFNFSGGGGDIVGLSTELISASVTQGKSSREYLWLNNIGAVPVDVGAEIEGFEGIAGLNVSLSESNFTIDSRGDKRLAIVFSASKDMTPGVYAGNITITTRYGRKVVNVFLTVNSPLFDMTIDVSPGTKVIEQGGKLNVTVSFYNLGMLGEFDINLTLKIADLDKNIIFTLPPQIIIMGKNQSMIKVAREIAIGNLALGRYMVLGEARYGNFGAEAYNLFEVRKNYGWTILLLILLELLLLLWLFLRRRHVAAAEQIKKLKARHTEHDKLVLETKIFDIKKDIKRLDDEYKKGTLEEHGYKKTREGLIKKLRHLEGSY